MKMHQVKAFLAVYEAGSLQSASQQLHLTQPALSRAIKDLEGEFGVSLFERSSRGIALTPYGERFLGYARLILQTVKRAAQDIENMKGGLSGEITLGITPITSTLSPLLTSIQAFKSRYPNVRLRIWEMRPTPLLESLREGKIDFAITSQVPAMENTFEWQPICRIPNMVVVRNEHPLRKATSLRMLQNSDWITLDPPGDQTTYLYQLFAVNGIPFPENVQECTSITLALKLMQTTDVAALLSEEALASSPETMEKFTVIRLVENVPDSLISLVLPRREIMTEMATELYRIMLEQTDKRYTNYKY